MLGAGGHAGLLGPPPPHPTHLTTTTHLHAQLSPYQQSVIGQAFKNAPKTFLHFIQNVRA